MVTSLGSTSSNLYNPGREQTSLCVCILTWYSNNVPVLLEAL